MRRFCNAARVGNVVVTTFPTDRKKGHHMIDQFASLAEHIAGIVTSAISGDWGELASSIVGTVGDTLGLGSSAIEGSSAAE